MNKKALITILFTMFLDMIGIGILIPVIPLLLGDPGSQYYLLSAASDPKAGYILLGILSATFPFAQFIAAPILGQLSDRYGRKRILLACLAGTAASYALFGLGIVIHNIPLLFISRAIAGFTGGSIAVAQAAMADITPPEDRTKTFGLLGMVFGLGFILGPLLGGILSNHEVASFFNAATPFWFSGILSCINIYFVIRFLPETLKTTGSAIRLRWSQSIHNIIKAFGFPGRRTLFTTSFLFQSGFAFFTSFFGVFLLTKFGYSQTNIGMLFAYVGIWVVITQGFITRIVSKYIKEAAVLKLTILAEGFFTFAYVIPQHAWSLFVWVIPFFAIFNGLSNSNLTSLISRSAGPEVQGEVLGINASMQALSNIFPPLFAGVIASQFSPEMPIIIGSGLIALSGIVFLLFLHKRRKILS